MSKFKVGDRVRLIKEDAQGLPVGSVVIIDQDSPVPYCHQDGEEINCRVISQNNAELVEESKPSYKFKVGDKVRACGFSKYGKHIPRGNYFISRIHNDGDISIDEGMYIVEPYQLELVEEKKDDRMFYVVDPVNFWSKSVPNWDIGSTANWDTDSIAPIQKQIIKTSKQTTMSKITTFVKNLTLSADEKLLRKYDLKDSDGDYTSEARELVMQKVLKDNEAYLIDIAKGLEAEEKKNK